MGQKITINTLKEIKRRSERFAMATCYDYATAVLLQRAGLESLLVGDSAAEVILGQENTRSATMELLITLTAAVRRGAPDVFLVGDLPFEAAQRGAATTVENARKFVTEAGCDIVKIELTSDQFGLIERLRETEIPVMAHLGYRPQQYRPGQKIVQTRSAEVACRLVQDGINAQNAGAEAILLECVTELVAKVVTELTTVPIISCGSGKYCDGQVLVLHELLGLPGAKQPKFAKQYGDIADRLTAAAGQYADEVRRGEFPDSKRSYHIDEQEEQIFWEKLDELGIKP